MSHTLQMRQPVAQEATATDQLPDRDLVQSAKTDPQAFAVLYTRYADPIFRHCYRRLGSREAAEDATSQVFTRALAALPRFENSNDAFRSWLFTIANHVLADHHRAEKHRGSLDSLEETPDVSRSPEELAIASDAERSLREAMERLPRREREVVELRLAGLTGPEIGAVLGCRRNAVAAAHFRAVNHLRAFLGIDIQPEGDSHV
jgi:RNA polymerase sigma-70 factor (ECF subfamily)